VSHGYLGGNGAQLDENSQEFRTALGRFQADSGMVVSGVVDFPTYERALRHFVSLGNDGRLAQIGWSTGSDAPQANSVDYRQPGVARSYGAAAYGAKASPRKIDLQIENVLVGRSAFELGEQVFLSATLSRASHLYCFLQEAGGKVLRLLPNATNPNALLSANQAIRIPDWMSPTPGFIMDSTSLGTERAGCFATDTDVSGKLPQLLRAPALAPLREAATLEEVNQAFGSSLGADAYTFASVQWLVGPKRAAAPAASAAPPAPSR